MQYWEKVYSRKKITAQEAANMIKSGDRIMTGARYTKSTLDRLLEREELHNVFLYMPVINYLPDKPIIGTGINVGTSFIDPMSKKLYEEGRIDFYPGEYWTFEKICRNKKCNVILIEATKPDANGYMSTGTSADFVKLASKFADLVIVETNSSFPFALGDNLMHISEADYIVDDGENYPWPSIYVDTSSESDSIYQKIGCFLSEIIDNEATIEVGLGRLNSAAMMYLENKRDLGIHTEVYGDLLMYLTKKGIVTNEKKSMNVGKSVFTQMAGSDEFFEWSKYNMGLEMSPCQYVLNPGVIQQQHRMTAINNAVEVDLLGQVNAEYINGKQRSGMGGICNFASGATACPDGKSVVVLESSAKNGSVSKIVSTFKPATPISIPRTCVEYVVTEYGVAKLADKDTKGRAIELINVANPDFREQLTKEAKEFGIL